MKAGGTQSVVLLGCAVTDHLLLFGDNSEVNSA